MSRREHAPAPGVGAEGGAWIQGGGSLPIVPPEGMSWQEVASHVDGTFVVLVRTTGGRYRRRCYLTVRAAESAARRAQGRGESAVVVLAELRPLYRLGSGGLE